MTSENPFEVGGQIPGADDANILSFGYAGGRIILRIQNTDFIVAIINCGVSMFSDDAIYKCEFCTGWEEEVDAGPEFEIPMSLSDWKAYMLKAFYSHVEEVDRIWERYFSRG